MKKKITDRKRYPLMKKYYMSFVDFSEIINVTADEELLGKA